MIRTNENSGLGLSLAVTAVAASLWVAGTLGAVQVSKWLTPRPEPALHPKVAKSPALAMLGQDVALHGRDVFYRTCAQCHASNGLGRAGLGKDLVRSDFVAGLGDDALVAFVEKGRPVDDPANTTKIPMPPKGGVEAMTADDLKAVVQFVRALQDPRRMPQLPAWTPPPPIVITEADKAAALTAAGGDAELASYIASGDKIFHRVCIACHGKGGVGIAGNGKALAKNDFVKSLDDDGLLAFIKQGRSPSDPRNTTGIQMPPKGGNPAMSDDDILDVISYLRTLQDKGQAAAGG